MSARSALLWMCAAVVTVACSAPREVAPADFDAGDVAEPMPAAGVRVELDPVVALNELDTSILLPSDPATDEVVARVGDVELRKSHVFDRLVESHRRTTRSLVDVLILDAVVASHAKQHGIAVDAAEIDAHVAREEELVRQKVRIDWRGRKSFDEYVRSQFDCSVEEYREFLRLELARARYRSFVIRFLGMLEDRVEVRLLANRDKKIVEDAARLVRDGADFATLAFRHSEDDTRRDGGRMPPFSRAFQHPIAQTAFELAEGELSEVIRIEVGGVKYWCIVYCLRRVPGHPNLQFAAVRSEIVEGLEKRALTEFEQRSFALRWCRDTDSLPSERPPR